MANKPVLDLGSLNPTRPYIRIDGVGYRMKVPMDIDLVTLSKLTGIDQRLEPKARKEKPTEKDAREFSEAIDEGVRLIMFDTIPDEVLDKLNEVSKLAILDAFPLATSRAGSQPNRAARRRAAKASRRSTSPASSLA